MIIPNSFIASATTITHLQKKPVSLIKQDQLIDPIEIENYKKNKSNNVVLCGQCLKSIKKISNKYNLPIIEDSAQTWQKYNEIESFEIWMFLRTFKKFKCM